MELKAKLKNVYTNIVDDCIEVVFEIENADIKKISTFNHKNFCRLKITNWSEKRSLDANSYLWVLCTKMAEILKTSKDEVYEEILNKYGYTDEEPIILTVKSEVDMHSIEGHWKFYRESSDGRFKAYMRIRGTSEYTQKEMAHVIDMVVDECKELGVETLPDEEIKHLKTLWDGLPK